MKNYLLVLIALNMIGCEINAAQIEQCGKSCKGDGTTMQSFSEKEGCKCMVTAPVASTNKLEK